jgi:hypothetical protein
MNEFLSNFHVVVFLKKLQLRIQEDLNVVQANLQQLSTGNKHILYCYENLIRWIEHYPDRGIPDIIEIKLVQAQKFRDLLKRRMKS